jgi:nitrile hydratase
MIVHEQDSGRMLAALRAVLRDKGLVRDEAVIGAAKQMAAASATRGAQMVARAWTDPAFRALMLRDGARAAASVGYSLAGAPPLGVLENTPQIQHLIVCTLCSCYPRGLLGVPPFWYKSSAYRARAVRDPRGLLAEWGTVVPANVSLRVVDSTADYRWMVLPMRPSGTDGWDEDRLMSLIGPEELIGVRLPHA